MKTEFAAAIVPREKHVGAGAFKSVQSNRGAMLQARLSSEEAEAQYCYRESLNF